MKKVNLTLLVLFIYISSFAQYKKANYFGKEGRTYGIGTRFYALGNGIGTRMGYYASISKETEGMAFFGGYEFQYIPKYSFSFETTDRNNKAVTTTGISKGAFIYQINFGWFLLKNTEDRKIKPYLQGSVITHLFGGVKESNSEEDDARYAAPVQFNVGIGAGAGSLFYLNSWLGLKGEAGYVYTVGVSGTPVNADTYFVFPKHAYVSTGLVFRIGGK